MVLPQAAPAANTRQRTALGDISNRGYSQLKDGKGAKVRGARSDGAPALDALPRAVLRKYLLESSAFPLKYVN